MDRRERSGDLFAGLLAMQETFSSEIRVAGPGIIQSFNAAKRTCVIQPAIKAQVASEDGTMKWVDLPLLLDCPVIFPGGGGFVLTFPLKQGDECLVIFADRCIDAWYQSGGSQVQAEFRLHDLSDGFCLPGVTSLPKVQPAISTTEVQLRNDAGTRGIRISATELEAVCPGASVKLSDNVVTVAATTINLNGAVIINGEAYTAHRHSGVTAGGANTGGKV